MSIRKRNWVTTKGESKTAFVVDYKDSGGKRRLKTFKLRRDADDFNKTAGVEVMKGIHTHPSASITVKAAGENWIEAGKVDGLERSTTEQMRQHTELHIDKYLGNKKLSELNTAAITAFRNAMLTGKGMIDGKTRSPDMTKRVISSLGALVSNAMNNGQVAHNVVSEWKSANRRKNKTKSRHKRDLEVGIDIPTPDEIRGMLESVSDKWRPVILTAVFTGMRASELRGLNWKNVDFENRLIKVRQRADKWNQIGDAKTGDSIRDIPLPINVVNTLKEWKLQCPKNEDKKLDLVFPTGAGNVEGHANLYRRGLGEAQIKAGITIDHKTKKDKEGNPEKAAKYGLHSLRHFHASWLINRKQDGGLELPGKNVQKRLGHSSIQVTLDLYGHLFPSGDDHLAELDAAQAALLA